MLLTPNTNADSSAQPCANHSPALAQAASPLLRVEALELCFTSKNKGSALPQKALRGVSFELQAGKILGLVGESGSGKSLTSMAILGLLPDNARLLAGHVYLQGRHLNKLSQTELRPLRGAVMALIPQDPMSALNPVYTVGSQMVEVLQAHKKGLSAQQAQQQVLQLLERVQIPNAKSRLSQYPHEFSGGMRQRVLIAMALSCKPALLIADEPTTALDVTVQAQILALLEQLRQEEGMGILLITHDLGVVAETCDSVAVMYGGQVVEQAEVGALFSQPRHPYTQGLLGSIPKLGQKRLPSIAGQPPTLAALQVAGCAFAPRCPKQQPACTQAPIPWSKEKATSHKLAQEADKEPDQQADQQPNGHPDRYSNGDPNGDKGFRCLYPLEGNATLSLAPAYPLSLEG